MSTIKKTLKSIKAHIEGKDFESALYEATEALKKVDQHAPEAAQILVFRGLALTHKGNKEEAEKCYLHAYRIQPGHPLAGKGLRKLYELDEAWDKLGRFLETLVQEGYEEGDGDKCATALQDLVELRSKHGLPHELYRTLCLLLPSSPIIPLLQAVPPRDPYIPFPSPIYPPPSLAVLPLLPSHLPHILHLVASLPLLLNLLIRSEATIHQEIEAKVKTGRTRLGAGTEKDARRKVDGEVLGGERGMEMVELLRQVAAHPGVDEAVRREVEVREFAFWRKLVGPLSDGQKPLKTKAKIETDNATLPLPTLFQPTMRSRPTKAEALVRADDLAKGFVLLQIASPGAEEGWTWVLEGKDEPTLFYDIELLHNFAHIFPTSPLTDFIDDYCRWFQLPLPEPEDVNTTTEAKQDKPKKSRWRKKPGQNARERRKTRRLAGKEGLLNEDLDQEERDELVAAMTRLLDQLPKSIFSHRVMTRIAIQEEDWANAIAYAEKGQNLVKEMEAERGVTLTHVRSSLETALGVALVPYFPPKHHPRATRLLNTVLNSEPTNTEARFARAQIFQTSGKWSEARRNFQMLLNQGGDEREMVAAREELGWCFVSEGKLEQGREMLEEVVEMRDSRWKQGGKEDEALPRARAWWRLGRTEWMIGDDESKQHAEEWFMASIRALSTYAPAYSSLGTCYLESTPPDPERAFKCFQKAFELDATETDAARRLAEGYADDDEWALVRTVANRVMEGEGGVEGVLGGEMMNAKGRFAPKNGWAWKALGSTEMHYRNYAKAAQAYQIALRADLDDVSTWVQLGESYVRCGRHIAGLKALQHALDLNPKNWMALYDIGDVYAQLGSFETAIESFTKVVEITGQDVGITAKMADAKLALGRQNAAGGFRERCRLSFHGAIRLAGEVLKMGGHRPWAWKVIGDATFELSSQESTLADAQSSAEVIHPILQLLINDDVDRRSSVDGLGHAANLLQLPINLETTLKASVFAFAYRVHLLKNEPRVADSALYDFASSLHALGPRSGGEDGKSCLKAAIGAIRLALERDAGDERLWNALGVICADAGEQVAQHAFVVSLELYGKDPIVWTNLGYLYLRLDDRDLANQCFLKAQIIDPDCARAWLGQGMLADRNGDSDHAKALFAHSVTLSAGSLLEADLAQAVATFTPLVDQHVDTSLLHAPTFALRHYTHQRPKDAPASHLYALLCERIGLVDEAASSLERAACLLEEEFEASESSEVERAYSIALISLGRVRLAASEYNPALEAFSSCWELVSSVPDDGLVGKLKVQSRLGQGLAYFWLDSVDQSLEAFQAALDLTTEMGVKDQVVVYLARTLWGVGGDDAKDAAKTRLMECLSQDVSPIQVVNTLAAIALVSSDDDLLRASISELQALSMSRLAESHRGEVSMVLSTHALARNLPDDSLKALEQAVHLSPSSALARNRLGHMLIAMGKAEEAVRILSEAGGESVSIKSETMRLRGIAKVMSGDVEGGVSEVTAAIRVCPWDEKNWQGMAWARKADNGSADGVSG